MFNWTVRNDADNLFNVFDISLQGVIDLQLYEIVRSSYLPEHSDLIPFGWILQAVRMGSKRFFNPLA
jgi:hypothetical protein